MWLIRFSFLFVLLLAIIECKTIVRTIAGTPVFGGDGKLAVNASLNQPFSIAKHPLKNEFYIADTFNHVVRRVDKNGIITTIAGTPGEFGMTFGGTATNTKLKFPRCVFATNEDVYICDTQNYALRKVNQNGTLSTVAGGIGFGSEGDGGLATNAFLSQVRCAFVRNNEIYICDSNNHVIRKINSTGIIQTVVGMIGNGGYSGDGTIATNAQIRFPTSIYVYPSGEMVITESENNIIRRVFANGTITTLAGRASVQGYSGDYGDATNALLRYPSGIYVSELSQDIYFSDTNNHVIRKIFANNNTIVTIAGIGLSDYNGDSEIASLSKLNTPTHITLTSEDDIYFADSKNNVIRKISAVNSIINTYAGFNTNSDKIDYNTKISSLSNPTSVFVTQSYDIYIADSSNHVIKKIDTQGVVTIIAGQLGQSGYNDNNTAIHTLLNKPFSVLMNEKTQDLYISDSNNNLIRKIDKHGIISTVAGNRNNVNTGYISTNVTLNNPTGIFLSSSNYLLIADSKNHIIRKIFLENSSLVTVAGIEGQQAMFWSDGGEGGLAINAKLDSPTSVAETEAGDLFIVSTTVIKHVSVSGIITTIQNVNMFSPLSVYVRDSSTFYFSDLWKVAKVNWITGTSQIVAGKEDEVGFTGDNKEPTQATFSGPYGVFITENGTIYIADTGNNVIRKVSDLCNEYFFHSTLSKNSNSDFIANTQRVCIDTEKTDYLNIDYLPLIEMNYKTSGQEFKTIVSNWNQMQLLANDQFTGQTLDLLTIQLNSFIPTADTSNFLFLPNIISSTFINYYRTTDAVTVLEVVLEFNNTKTGQIDKRETVNTGLTTIEVFGLQHSTTYQVKVNTTVTYSNGFVISSVDSIQQFTTSLGIAPSVNVQNIQLFTRGDSFLLSWDAAPSNDNGNVVVSYIELESASLNRESELTKIPYIAATNNPSSYIISVSQLNTQYSFRVRICSAVGCGNYSDSITGIIEETSNNSNVIVAAVVSSFVIVLVIVTLIALVVSIVVLLLVILLVKRKINPKASILEVEMINDLVSNNFKIDESHIDLSNSQFIGSGASGSVVTAKYFNHKVAVKIIQKSTAGIEADMTDFYNELKFLNSNTQHMNIIRFFGVYDNTKKNHIGLVMEWCSKGDVATYISKFELDFKTKLALIQGIANGMVYLHHFDIAHRDLKCENVLLDENLVPKIIDFGFSKIIEKDANKSLNLTMNIGTAVYCAPEVIQLHFTTPTTSSSINSLRSNQVSLNSASTNHTPQLFYNKKCDIYSFGIIIWVIYFQNKNPYGSNVTDNQILYQLTLDPNFRPKVDELVIPQTEMWLIKLMKNCWKTKPDERPSFEAIVTVLNNQQI